MLRVLGKLRNVVLITEARTSLPVPPPASQLLSRSSPSLFQCQYFSDGGRPFSSMTTGCSQSMENKIYGVSSAVVVREQRRNYWTKEGRVGYRRKKAMEKAQREKILEPSTPLIDYKYPWPKDDTEGLPPGLFGEEVTVLSREEERIAQNQIVGNINKQIEGSSHGRLFAVVHVAGKQFKVTPEDIIVIQEFFPPTTGDQIRLNKVLLVGGKDFTLVGRPLLDNEMVRIEATVIEKTLSYTKLEFAMIKRENYRRLNFKKNMLTFLRINLIEMMQPLDLISQSEYEAMENVVHDQKP